jgi:L-threonylcarbamoyladenylate synthase
MTIILRLDPDNPSIAKIRLAARMIKEGKIVVFPTETVYGIGANALDAKATGKIFKIKGRPSDNPIIVHVSSIKMAEKIAIIPKMYAKSIRSAWPAPLTIIVPARKSLPKVVTGGLSTVAIRMPANKIALALIRESGVPIAAPSANISKKPSSTNASHAKKYFNGKVDAIIDSGSSKFGVESTVIDLNKFEILRPGAFTPEEIRKYFGKTPKIGRSAKGTGDLKSKAISPGTKYRHYSPTKKLFIFTGKISLLPDITQGIYNFTFIGSDSSSNMMKRVARNVIGMGNGANYNDIAHNLFDALIKVDSTTSSFAIMESFKEKGIGLAIMNRLRKASGNKSFKNRKELDNLINSP